jgi:hypothetical protein
VFRFLVLAAIFRSKTLLIVENLCLRQQLLCCSAVIRDLAGATPIGASGVIR